VKHAFKDSADGYYEVDVADGADMPEWTHALLPCAVVFPGVVLPTVADQLAKLDTDNTLTQRNLREFILLTAQAVKTLNPALDITQLPGVAKVAQVEAEAAALRAKL
jgi:hypothetical protein